MKSKFKCGDRVHIAKDLGPCMQHFPANCNVVVIGTYASECGYTQEGDHQIYTLDIDGRGPTAWYYEHQLTPIKG